MPSENGFIRVLLLPQRPGVCEEHWNGKRSALVAKCFSCFMSWRCCRYIYYSGCLFDTYVFITQMMLSPQHYWRCRANHITEQPCLTRSRKTSLTCSQLQVFRRTLLSRNRNQTISLSLPTASTSALFLTVRLKRYLSVCSSNISAHALEDSWCQQLQNCSELLAMMNRKFATSFSTACPQFLSMATPILSSHWRTLHAKQRKGGVTMT